MVIRHIVLIVATAAVSPASAQNLFVVNSTVDPGNGVCDATECTLAEAIDEANQDAARDTILFAIPGEGTHTIQPDGWLPIVSNPVLIDGFSQPGARPATSEEPAHLMIEIDGSTANADIHGIEIESDRVTIRGLAVNRFARGGILIDGSNNMVVGCHIGTNVAGDAALGNGYESDDGYLYDGVWILEGTKNVIGGNEPALRNIVSGNANAGVFVSGQGGNRVEGNYIGTDAEGTEAAPNENMGVAVFASPNNRVHGNVVSGNLRYGIDIWEHEEIEEHSSENVITGNRIGIDAGGMQRLGNGEGGILFNGSDNIVGGPKESDRNVISGNLGSGIVVFDPEGPVTSTGNQIIGNWIGLNATGDDTLGNLGTGVRLVGSENVVGGPNDGEGNVISGNLFAGVSVRGDIVGDPVEGNRIQGNFLGTDRLGMNSLGNIEDGVALIATPDNLVGGEAEGAGNLMGANLGGVFVYLTPSVRNVIQGNAMGVASDGSGSLPNEAWGVEIVEASSTTVSGNTIANNGSGGVSVAAELNPGKRTTWVRLDMVGIPDGHGGIHHAPTNSLTGNDHLAPIAKNSAEGVLRNRIVDNALSNNGSIGIDLGQDGATTNDEDDLDEGPNRLQNHPSIESATLQGKTLTLNVGVSTATQNASYPIEIHVYSSDTHGQGAKALGSVEYGEATAGVVVEASLELPDSLGDVVEVVATATDAEGNTSEFSPPMAVEQLPVATERETNLPERLTLTQNYPNPFNPVTTIAYTLPRTSAVSLIVLDLLGRVVARPLDRKGSPPGFYTISFDAKRLPAGVYLYRLEANGRRITRKMTLLR